MPTPMAHQAEGEALAGERGGFAWFLETGTGKTYTAILNIARLYRENKLRAAIIIAPKNVYREVWETELNNFMPADVPFYTVWFTAGLTDREESRLDTVINNYYNDDHLKIILINVESFSSKQAHVICLRIMSKYQTIVVVDESTFIKNPQVKRTRNILMLTPFAKYRRIMSGYPVLNSPEDLWSQIKFLGVEIPFSSFLAFRNFYCILKPIGMGKISVPVGYRNLDHLAELLSHFSYRKLKADCLELPEKIYEKRYVSMTIEQAKHYENMTKQARVTFSDGTGLTATNLMTLANKLQQIANGIVYTPVGPKFIENNKAGVLVDILGEEIGKKQVVIWSRYTENIKYLTYVLRARFGNSSTESIFGDTGPRDRHFLLNKFQDEKYLYLLTNPASLGHGIKLLPSHYSIYYNNDFSLEHRVQSESRQHRAGQTNKVTYIDLITKNTIEDYVLEKLQDKMDVSAAILGDQLSLWLGGQ
jgi:SNF2 family DNA or RNA helicase